MDEQLTDENTRFLAAHARNSTKKLRKDLAELKKSEARYRAIVELANSIILVFDPSGKILFLNRFGQEFFGYTRREIIGRNLIGSLVPAVESSGRSMSRLVHSMSEDPGKYTVNENENLCKDGRRVWVLWTNRAVFDKKGVIKEIFSVGNDITQKKHLEQHLVETRDLLKNEVRERTDELEKTHEELKYEVVERKIGEEELRENERKYRTIVEGAVEGIFQATGEGICVMANGAMAKMLGYESPEEFKRVITDAEHQLFADPARYREMGKILSEKGQVKGFETQYVRKEGTPLWVSVNARAVRDERGSFVCYEGIVEDISERKAAEVRLKEHYAKLQRVMDGTIKALSMAVEIRDPYTAGHQFRVTRLAEAIARDMNFSEDHIKAIQVAGILHDIGKIYVPAEILTRPGKISIHEYAVLRDHSEAGYEILKDIEFDYPIAEIVLQHHERLDGSGYPHGLKGDRINVEAKIISVADVVESMASHRPYRPSLGIEKALKEIRDYRGTLYDAAIVDACLRQFLEKGFVFEK